MQQAAVAVVGGGILGLTTAYHLTQRAPDRRVVVLEKEASWASIRPGIILESCTRVFTTNPAR